MNYQEETKKIMDYIQMHVAIDRPQARENIENYIKNELRIVYLEGKKEQRDINDLEMARKGVTT